MSVAIGWVVLIAVLCFVAGITITVIVAAFLATPPMDGHTHTGDLPPLRGDP